MKDIPLRSGLTGMELMFAIFILSILAAFTQPHFGSIREDVRRIQCRENMRQIGLAVLAHENEHGTLPGPIFRRVRRPEGAVDLRELNWIMDAYLGQQAAVWNCPTNTLLLDGSLNPGGVVFVLNNISNRTDPPRWFGYPFSSMPLSLDEIRAAGQNPLGVRVRDLNGLWMMSDADGLNYSAASIGVGPGSYPIHYEVPPIHGGGRNYVFLDGHAEYRLQGEFPP